MCKTSDILTEFGLAIRELRLERQISQEALADICGLHRTYVILSWVNETSLLKILKKSLTLSAYQSNLFLGR